MLIHSSQYAMYLFESILLCCKELISNKVDNRKVWNKSEPKEKVRLQLKGRILIKDVTEVLCLNRERGSSSPSFKEEQCITIHRILQAPDILERAFWCRRLYYSLPQ